MESNEKSKNTSALPTRKSTNKGGINNDSRRFTIPGLKARGFQLIVKTDLTTALAAKDLARPATYFAPPRVQAPFGR